jgi:uncharacterized protein YndB with AHSA1/START domain
MERTKFLYVTYIATTPEKVWEAIVDPAVTATYWQNVNISDWKPGSRWEHRDTGEERTLRLVGRVLEAVPPRRLVLTWLFPGDEGKTEKETRVAFDVEPYRSIVRLKLKHDRLEPGSEMWRGISEGWPMVLSSLKTLLETGRPLPKLW